jgi:hypothetical protein
MISLQISLAACETRSGTSGEARGAEACRGSTGSTEAIGAEACGGSSQGPCSQGPRARTCCSACARSH